MYVGTCKHVEEARDRACRKCAHPLHPVPMLGNKPLAGLGVLLDPHDHTKMVSGWPRVKFHMRGQS